MDPGGRSGEARRWTRGGALRAALGGGTVVAAGAVLGGRGTGAVSTAAPSARQDAEILNGLLLLEYVQHNFYREAVRRGRLRGELLEFATDVGRQEDEHIRFLSGRLGAGARPRPRSDFGSAPDAPDSFATTAIQLEEATIAAYIGQGANLRRTIVGDVATLVSVEARQAAWVRDIAGVNPAPEAADGARGLDEVLAELRDKGFLA
jgi:hypothetical protein